MKTIYREIDDVELDFVPPEDVVVLHWTGPGHYGGLRLNVPPRATRELYVTGWVTTEEAAAISGQKPANIAQARARGRLRTTRQRGAFYEYLAEEVLTIWPPK